MSEREEEPEEGGEKLPDVPALTGADLAASATRVLAAGGGALVGGVPSAVAAALAAAVGEAIVTIIPRQRTDRLEGLMRRFGPKVAHVDPEKLAETMRSPEFIDLFEDVVTQATRAMSEERIGYLASLLATGVTDEAAGHEQNKKMPELLAQLTDAEVVWLGSYASHQSQREYSDKHEAILAPRPAHIGADAATVDASTLRDSWREKLYRLDLIKRQIRKDSKTKQPEFDSLKGDWKYDSPRLTWLGAMLLNSIGIDTDLRGKDDSPGREGY